MLKKFKENPETYPREEFYNDLQVYYAKTWKRCNHRIVRTIIIRRVPLFRGVAEQRKSGCKKKKYQQILKNKSMNFFKKKLDYFIVNSFLLSILLIPSFKEFVQRQILMKPSLEK